MVCPLATKIHATVSRCFSPLTLRLLLMFFAYWFSDKFYGVGSHCRSVCFKVQTVSNIFSTFKSAHRGNKQDQNSNTPLDGPLGSLAAAAVI